MPLHQRVKAYLWLAFLFVTLAGANFCFVRFSFHPQDPFPVTRGLAIGSTLWSTVLFIAMMMHKGWSRYVLASLLVVTILGFGLATLMMNTQSLIPLPGLTRLGVIGLGLAALALVPLGFSRSIRYHLAPRTAGGR